MSSVKITELQQITTLNANTSNTLLVGVDLSTGITGKITATTIAQRLYANNTLNVGNNSILLPNVVAQFSGSSNAYLQMNMQNFGSNGSGDIVITADKGTDSNAFIDFGLNGSNFNDTNFSSMKSYDGYLYIMGPDSTQTKGNLIIGTTGSQNAHVSFIINGTKSENVVARITNTGFNLNSNKILTFGDNSTQSVAAQPAAYTQNIYDLANGLYSISNTSIANLSTANTWLQANDAATLTVAKAYTDTANTYAQSHYLANTSGTFGGNLTITGNANVSGYLSVTGVVSMNNVLVLSNSNFSATEAAVTIKATANTQTPSNDGYMLHISGKQDVPSRIVFDSFGANTYGLVAGRTARGTVDAPTAVQSGDVLMRLSGNGWGTTGFAPLGVARIDVVATETYTDAHRGSQIKFYNTPDGSNTLTNIATFNGDSAVFTGVIEPQKGMIVTPNNITGITNTLNIDIANNALYKITIDNTAAINLSGYQTGKIVEVWMTNSSGSGRTVTHGCTALNSSVNSTTFTIPATSSAYLKYFSIDGDNANTFVSINHA